MARSGSHTGTFSSTIYGRPPSTQTAGAGAPPRRPTKTLLDMYPEHENDPAAKDWGTVHDISKEMGVRPKAVSKWIRSEGGNQFPTPKYIGGRDSQPTGLWDMNEVRDWRGRGKGQ